jgi:hypothetical protein
VGGILNTGSGEVNGKTLNRLNFYVVLQQFA